MTLNVADLSHLHRRTQESLSGLKEVGNWLAMFLTTTREEVSSHSIGHEVSHKFQLHVHQPLSNLSRDSDFDFDSRLQADAGLFQHNQ